MKKLFSAMLLIPVLLAAQNTNKDSTWMPLKPFTGEWAGQGGGEPGKAIYERSYRFILHRNFIEIRNKATYEPNAKNPQGEIHEDVGYFSYDKGLKKFRLRQFHQEGFVNDYLLDSISADKKTLVFVTVNIENIPVGFRAREIYRLLSDDEIEESFEIAPPGKPFQIYSTAKLSRIK